MLYGIYMIDNDDDQDQNITYGTLIDQSIDDDNNVIKQ